MARQQYIRDRDRDVPARPQSPADSWFAAGFNAVVSIVLAVAALVTVFFAWRASQESRRAADLAQQAVLAVRAADEADERDRKIRQLREIGLLTESIQKLASRQQLTDSVGVGVGVGCSVNSPCSRAGRVRGTAWQVRDPGRTTGSPEIFDAADIAGKEVKLAIAAVRAAAAEQGNAVLER
jgi:hypothetical protein